MCSYVWQAQRDLLLYSNASQSSYGGGLHDAFATAFNAGGGSLGWSTYRAYAL